MNRNILSGLPFESKEIFGLMLHKGALTKGELAELSGLKLTSLNRMMQPLEELGLIVKAEIGESTGGRKPVLYDVNPRKYYVVGIDISRIYTQVVLTNLKLDYIEKYRFEMNKESTPQRTLKLIWAWIKDAIEKLKKQNGMVIGIGIGTVGPLDRSNGVVLNPQNFEAEGWENVPLKSIFEDILGIPVVIDNGANAAVLAETYYGIGKGIRNVIYINCGIGIRTGVISSGVFVRNINDAEDAFAHMVIDVNGEKCRCGNLGCIERYSSIYSITEKFIANIKKESTGLAQKELEQFSYTDICKAAEASDDTAKQVVSNAAVIMGNGLANLIKLLNPGIVVLSGPLIKHSKLFYQECTETALKKSHMNSKGDVFFSRGGHFDENAISIGSAAMVLENYLDKGGLN
jgi:predicted NBD/HSP70 family sugar kinase